MIQTWRTRKDKWIKTWIIKPQWTKYIKHVGLLCRVYCICNIYVLVQDWSNSIANALELLQSFTKPSMYFYSFEWCNISDWNVPNIAMGFLAVEPDISHLTNMDAEWVSLCDMLINHNWHNNVFVLCGLYNSGFRVPNLGLDNLSTGRGQCD